MALKHAQDFISEDEYLNGEMIVEVRHEYIDGQVFAIAGAQRNHQRISGNAFSAFTQLERRRGRPLPPSQ